MMAKTTKDTRYRRKTKPKAKDGFKITMTDQEEVFLAIRACIVGAEVSEISRGSRLVQTCTRHDGREDTGK